MTSHELAKLLLALPDLPVATHANNHTYMSGTDARTHGAVKIGRLQTAAGDHLMIGNFDIAQINPPNWYITEMFVGEVSDAFGVLKPQPGKPATFEEFSEATPKRFELRKLTNGVVALSMSASFPASCSSSFWISPFMDGIRAVKAFAR